MRTIAIGDIHGCSVSLNILLGVIDPQPDDTIIALGDYTDRGPDSKAVIERLIALKEQCTFIPILGNHELMLMRALGGKDDLKSWLYHGGMQTLRSYGWDGWSVEDGATVTPDTVKRLIPYRHMHFIAECAAYHEDDKHIFVHANYEPDTPLESQTENAQFWHHIRPGDIPPPHSSGKTVWVGHSPQSSGNIWDLGHVVCIDTYAFHPERGGWLTAIDVNSREIWQANEFGNLRGLEEHNAETSDNNK
jgi:serine/threonine protein phosphatase 1